MLTFGQNNTAMPKISSPSLYEAMLAAADPSQVPGLSRFFKTGPGQYGEGDKFLGIKVPVTRAIVKEYRRGPAGAGRKGSSGSESFPELERCISSEYHEVRLAALLALVDIFTHARELPLRQRCIDFYLSHTERINNWDLVDLSCYPLLGEWLLDKDRSLLYDLARNGSTIWEQRIGIVSTMTFIRHGELADTFAIADILLNHPHDLIHKAVGWLLREAGKRDAAALEEYLLPRYRQMPRTMLRYAIEKFPEPIRQQYLHISMKLPYRLIIFDLDGTLLDTLEDLAAAVNHALSVRNLPLHSLQEYRAMVGHGVRNLVQQALEKSLGASGKPDDALIDAALADFKAYYTSHIDVHTHPYPGIQALVQDLHAAGVRMAVASNKFQAGTEKLVREFFPGIPFVAILGNREGYPLKPDPEIVGEVLRTAVDIEREEAVMVGDSRTDMLTAANGGISAIAVGWGYRIMEASDNYRLAGSVTELRTLLFGRPFYVSEPVSTPPENPSTELQKLVYETIAKLEIPFSRVDCDPGITMEDCAQISARIGVDIVKTVFLCNRQQTEFYLYVMPAGKPFVTRDFCAALGIPRVSFASADKLMELTGVTPGATTILSSVWPAASGVHLAIDREVAEAPELACTDGTPTCFVRIATADLLGKYLCGRELDVI